MYAKLFVKDSSLGVFKKIVLFVKLYIYILLFLIVHKYVSSHNLSRGLMKNFLICLIKLSAQPFAFNKTIFFGKRLKILAFSFH